MFGGGGGERKFCCIFSTDVIFAKGVQLKCNLCAFLFVSLRYNNTLCPELLISANKEDWHHTSNFASLLQASCIHSKFWLLQTSLLLWSGNQSSGDIPNRKFYNLRPGTLKRVGACSLEPQPCNQLSKCNGQMGWKTHNQKKKMVDTMIYKDNSSFGVVTISKMDAQKQSRQSVIGYTAKKREVCARQKNPLQSPEIR